ncbi:MAG: 3-isopropylmalate dehydratase small subunit, partial [Terriglobia bacterium]
EHAAWALLDYGIRAVIAPSFADIFSTNCSKNGILLVALPADVVDDLFAKAERAGGLQLTVDLETETVTDAQGLRLPFKTDPFRRECLLEGLDDIGRTLRLEKDIAAYEKGRQPQAVRVEPVSSVS